MATANLLVEGVATNALTTLLYSTTFGEPDLTACVAALRAEVGRVRQADLGGVEAMLTAQAVTLNAIFTHLALRASQLPNVDHVDLFSRLALKAQSQCRTTIETLVLMKHPPTVFARQANITSGPQQVNNGPVVNGAPSRAGHQDTEPIKLLEAYGERLDGRATDATGRGDQAMATVGTLDGATDRNGQGARIAQRRPRRRTSGDSRGR